MVPAGSIIELDVRGTAGGWVPVSLDALRTELLDNLNAYCTVRSIAVKSVSAFYELEQWQFIASITVQTWEAYGAGEDFESIVTHAVYDATGYGCTIGAKGSQGDPNSGGSWIDSITAAAGNAIQNVSATVGAAIDNATKPIVKEFNTILIVVAVVAIVLVVSVGGKTTRIGI